MGLHHQLQHALWGCSLEGQETMEERPRYHFLLQVTLRAIVARHIQCP